MPNLAQDVYTLLSQVPKGRVTTYKALANAVNSKAYRAIGQILRTNPNAPQVPCHRVVRSDGSIGGYKGQTSGVEIRHKIAILKKEGVDVINGKVVNFDKISYRFE